eukprot:18136-Hanusia_phi.AAC.1
MVPAAAVGQSPPGLESKASGLHRTVSPTGARLTARPGPPALTIAFLLLLLVISKCRKLKLPRPGPPPGAMIAVAGPGSAATDVGKLTAVNESDPNRLINSTRLPLPAQKTIGSIMSRSPSPGPTRSRLPGPARRRGGAPGGPAEKATVAKRSLSTNPTFDHPDQSTGTGIRRGYPLPRTQLVCGSILI